MNTVYFDEFMNYHDEPRQPLLSDFLVLDHNVNMDVEEINPGWVGTNSSISKMIYEYVTDHYRNALTTAYNVVDEKEFTRQFLLEYKHLPNLNLVALIEYAVGLKKAKRLNDNTLQAWYAAL